MEISNEHESITTFELSPNLYIGSNYMIKDRIICNIDEKGLKTWSPCELIINGKWIAPIKGSIEIIAIQNKTESNYKLFLLRNDKELRIFQTSSICLFKSFSNDFQIGDTIDFKRDIDGIQTGIILSISYNCFPFKDEEYLDYNPKIEKLESFINENNQ